MAHACARARARGSRKGRQKLEEALAAARTHVANVARAAGDQDTEERERQRRSRQEAARERAARERAGRLEKAMAKLDELERTQRKRTDRKVKPPRVSTTDPEATMQRMPNGGKDIAHNIQWTTEVKTRAVVAVSVCPAGSDTGALAPAMENVRRLYGQYPARVLADRGYFKYDDIGHLEGAGCRVSMPDLYPDAKPSRRPDRRAERILAWRERMKHEAEQGYYRLRSSTVEWSNACVRRQGLQQLTVRGRQAVLAVSLLHALAHNMMRILSLVGAAFTPPRPVGQAA